MRRWFLVTYFCFVALGITSCANSSVPPLSTCRFPESGVLYLHPTSTALAHPDLTPTATLDPSEVVTPTATATTANMLPYCTPTPDVFEGGGTTPVPIVFGRGAGDVRNLTLDVGDASIETTAVGRYVSAVAWREGAELIIATTEGGSDLHSRSIGAGQQVAMVYSLTDRLHLAYVLNGAIQYRAADSGTHPADAAATQIGTGTHPFLAIDNDGWAHVLYIEGGAVHHRVQGSDGWSAPETIAPGSKVTATFAADGGLVAVLKYKDLVRVYRQDSLGAAWTEKAAFAPDDNIMGTPQVDADGNWVYIAFITERLLPYSGDWPNFRPEYKPAAPWANRIQSGANAQQYFTRFAVHNAGVYQQVPVTGNILNLTAWGQTWSSDESCESPLATSCNPTDMRLQIGIDPTGGLNPAGGGVVWSPPANPIDHYAPMSVSTPAQGSTGHRVSQKQPGSASLPQRHLLGQCDPFWR